MDHPQSDSAVDIERRFDLQPGTLGTALACLVAGWPAGLCLQDASGRLLFVNQVMADLFERPRAEMLGGRVDDWLDQTDSDALREAESAAAGQTDAQTRFHSLHIAGRPRGFFVSRLALPQSNATVRGIMCSIWREHHTALPDTQPGALLIGAASANAAAVDPSAPIGRTLFDDQLRRELDLSNREQREFALVAIAIDRPDQPAAGPDDEAARQRVEQDVDRLLRGNIRAMDSSFRVAANLFFMILSGVGLATAHSRVEALRRQYANEAAASAGNQRRSSISIGVASYPHTTREREQIVRAAEAALANARRRGGNQVALARIPFNEA
ncbi:diguanylate cyclase [Piscinibacter sakaiensis]|uniref:sensor domain-containing diguanylate cyclase n=1 Tax=Piscinibacter sakaiensis TaxID=1547922 RepID=UPI003AAD97CD